MVIAAELGGTRVSGDGAPAVLEVIRVSAFAITVAAIVFYIREAG